MIGIYALFWLDEGLVYVGQSTNVHNRLYKHRRELENNSHYNHKIQEAYNNNPKYEIKILEECLISQLDCREIYWEKELNSNLNIISCGNSGGSGIKASGSKYPKIKILQVFRALTRINRDSIKNISIKYNVSIDTVRDIQNSSTHSWLEEKYPGLNRRKSVSDRAGENNPSSKYSNKDILRVFSYLYRTKYSIAYISKITKVHPSTINQIIAGNNHKWLKEKYFEKFNLISKIRCTVFNVPRYLINQEGKVVEVLTTSIFIQEYMKDSKLSESTLRNEFARLFNGKRNEYKGWSRYG